MEQNLFKIKEKMLKELTESVESKKFETEELKQAYYEACMESIMKFYAELQHQDAA